MNLAWKEIKFYKFRYILIMLIIFLLGSMVLFINGLAQGLARENVSFLNNQNAQTYIIEKMKEPKIETSQLDSNQQNKIEDIINQQATHLGPQTLKLKQQDQDILTFSTSKEDRPSLKEGHYPNHSHEIAINDKLTGQDVKKGDTIKFKGHKEAYKVSGIIEDTMYSHSSMVMMNHSDFKALNKNYSTFYPVKELSKKDKNRINDISNVTTVSEKTLTDNIASYQAEQMPLNLMIISLFVITAIVLSAFFYVMTIQKIPQIGILKAVGIKTRHLLSSLIIEIILTTMVGVILATVLILILSLIMPVTMPFYLSYGTILLMIVIFLIVGFIGALLSFIKVVKVDPIDAIGGME